MNTDKQGSPVPGDRTRPTPPTRRMDAAEAFQTYPVLKDSVKHALRDYGDTYDMDGLTLELSQESLNGSIQTVGRIVIPRTDPERAFIRLLFSPDKEEPAK